MQKENVNFDKTLQSEKNHWQFEMTNLGVHSSVLHKGEKQKIYQTSEMRNFFLKNQLFH